MKDEKGEFKIELKNTFKIQEICRVYQKQRKLEKKLFLVRARLFVREMVQLSH